MSIFVGDGNGAFSFLDSFSVGGIFESTVGNFNGDSHLDLATTRATTFGAPRKDVVSIFLGNGLGNFSFLADSPTGSSATSIVARDFNGDTFLDLVQSSLGDGSISVLFGDGTGRFLNPINFATSSIFPASIAVGDFNEDGFSDIAVTDGDGVSIFLWIP